VKTIKERLIEMIVERCWKGYKPVPGKKPYSKGSCKSVNEGYTTGKNAKATGSRVGAASKSMQSGETSTKKSPEQVKKQVTSIKDRIQKRHGDAGVGKFFDGYRSVKPRGSRAKIKEGKTPAWQRSEGKNPEGGLNAKGRASAKAQGHNLKPPVSAEQAKKSDKSAARRRSFCARMSGHKRKNTSSKTANDPNSRVNKALRKWDC